MSTTGPGLERDDGEELGDVMHQTDKEHEE